MGVKFVHIADVHLDTPFKNREKEVRSKLLSWVRESFLKAVDLAVKENVNALLIAGDLVDSSTFNFATELFLTDQMKRLQDAGINVFYTPGNHDPYKEITRINWPDNVKIFNGAEPSTFDLKDNNGTVLARITGIGHLTENIGENLVKRLEPGVQDGVPYIGLIHTMVIGHGGAEHEKYAPCRLEDLLEKRYTYWALGHIHKRELIADYPYVVYPGSLIGRNPKETGQKGGYLVEISDDGYVEANFVPIAPIIWAEINIDNLNMYSGFDELLKLIKDRINQEIMYYKEKVLLRVNLIGPTPLYNELKLEDNIETLTDEILSVIPLQFLEIDNSRISQFVELAKFYGQAHVLSTALEIIENLKQDDELLIGLKPERLAGLLSSEKEDLILYLRSLLDNMDYDVTAMLLREEI